MVTKERLRSLRLDAALAQAWQQMAGVTTEADGLGRFPLITLEIRRNSPTPALFEFIRQDHIAFWNYATSSQEESPLPAVLFTDTGKWRGIQRMCPAPTEAAQQIVCPVESLLTPDRLDLLDQIVLTLDRYVSDSQLEGKRELLLCTQLRYRTTFKFTNLDVFIGVIDAQPTNRAISDAASVAIFFTLFVAYFLF